MIRRSAIIASMLIAAGTVFAQDKPQEWEVHDRRRPQPPVVTPGEPSSQEKPGTAPSDAIALFDGKDLNAWQAEAGGEPKWKLEDSAMTVAKGAGTIRTKQEFGPIQLHVEWQTPKGTEGKDQHRGNSGVFLMGMYEIQVLDNHGSKTYPDGTAGDAYGQHVPQANALRPQGEWQFYDIVFHPPVYSSDGMKEPARVTAFVNGVLTLDNVKLLGPTKHKELTSYPKEHPEKGPIGLQDHGEPVKFRNIWVRELKEAPSAPVKSADKGYEIKE